MDSTTAIRRMFAARQKGRPFRKDWVPGADDPTELATYVQRRFAKGYAWPTVGEVSKVLAWPAKRVERAVLDSAGAMRLFKTSVDRLPLGKMKIELADIQGAIDDRRKQEEREKLAAAWKDFRAVVSSNERPPRGVTAMRVLSAISLLRLAEGA